MRAFASARERAKARAETLTDVLDFLVKVADPATLEPVPGWAPIEETVTCRVFTHPEIAMLGEMAGLEVVATYGDMDQSVGLNDDDAHNMVVALKKI